VNKSFSDKLRKKKEREMKKMTWNEQSQNPYFDPKLVKFNTRKPREFKWIVAGTGADDTPLYTETGLKTDAMEVTEVKNEEEDAKKKKEMDEENEFMVEMTNFEKMMLMPEIPEAEWWDKPFLQGYPQEDADSTKTIEVKNGRGYGTEFEDIPILESAVNSYIVRPRPILPPNEKSKAEPVDIQLTRKERRKLIRINRSNKRKEEREAILLGIKEAPKPRVRIANMMRVHGTEAMQDPTLLETIVRKEMREREQRHDARNQERKLTPEQRKEKNRRKYLEDTSLCTYVSIFKVMQVQDETNKLSRKK